jgi:tetratricopeptide (TPR) repeat protein
MDVIERLVGLYNYSADHKGSHYELLRLAVIQALVYVHGADERVEQIFTDTKQFVTAREQAHIAATDIFEPSETWLDILAAQLLNFKGYFYRLRYQLDQSQRQYQRSIALAERHAGMLPQLRATTLNNLAFVLSEQGNVTESRRIAKEALQLRKYYSSRYDVGTSYNTLARIEIRAGHPQQARRHADRAIEIFKQLKSIRGRSLCLPVLAETYRKEAELLDLNDEQDEQSMLFEKAVTILHEALNELTMHNIKLPERWREAYQRLGCTHRSWGHALHERDRTNPAAAEQFKQAHHYLTQAYEVSLGHQPNLILMDIQEDLAVVYVNQDEYDQRIEYHLNKAEELAPAEYKIQFGFGLSRPNSAVTGYWRILGQCELQRMLASFGAYDYGYNQHSDDGTQIRVRYQDPQDLVAAGQHMLLSLAYLTMYARESPMLELAEELMLRELRFRRGEDKLKIISASLDETARLYHLQENDAYKIVDDLLAQVRPNPMLL